MLLFLVGALLLLVGLTVERLRLERGRDSIPLRIAVTGTRGKTGVARMLASVLREGGRSVLAKTTGSEPMLVLPDGSVEPIRRRGPASILEQKALLHRAARLGVDTVVAEVMSIHAENHEVESRRILMPHMVLVTNFRVDHTEAVGPTRQDVAAVLALDVPDGATAFVPESEREDVFRSVVEGGGGGVVEVAAGTGAEVASGLGRSLNTFAENVDLVVAAARALDVDDDTIRRGIERARLDVGAVGIWQLRREDGAAPAYVVSAFAANDPESTIRIHDRVMAVLAETADGAPPPCVGLLSLRADRGDRSLQWADALAGGLVDRFERLLVTGLHARALERRVRRSRAPGGEAERARVRAVGSVGGRVAAERLTATAVAELDPAGGAVFGFGNIGGLGEELVRLWSRTGEAVVRGN